MRHALLFALAAWAIPASASAQLFDLSFAATLSDYGFGQNVPATVQAALPLGTSVAAALRFDDDGSAETPASGTITIGGNAYLATSSYSNGGGIFNGKIYSSRIFYLVGPTVAAYDAEHDDGTLALFLSIPHPTPSASSVADFPYNYLGVGFSRPDGSNSFYADLAFSSVRLTAAAVPEPTQWTMLIVGFVAAGASLRRRRRLPVAA